VSSQERAKPLILAWEPGSDVIGDFVWPGADSEVVVTDRVLCVLQGRFRGFEPGSVEMVDWDLPGGRRKPRVRLPYQGPGLHEFWVTSWVHLNPDRSTVELEKRCGTCGHEFWKLYGVERSDWKYDRERPELVVTKTDRLPNAGIFLSETDLAGASIFRVFEFPGLVFCTDPVRDLIEQEGFSNAAFMEMGDTLPDGDGG
jgi:hypothetical protein